VNLSEREKELILNGLYLLECELVGLVIEGETKTTPEEVRILMNKIQGLFEDQ
jgi:hypothetical protein